MHTITEKKYKDERYIAYHVIEKIKAASIALVSDDPNHKDGLKYSISKKQYEAIIEVTCKEKCARHINTKLIKDFINNKLEKL